MTAVIGTKGAGAPRRNRKSDQTRYLDVEVPPPRDNLDGKRTYIHAVLFESHA